MQWRRRTAWQKAYCLCRLLGTAPASFPGTGRFILAVLLIGSFRFIFHYVGA